LKQKENISKWHPACLLFKQVWGCPTIKLIRQAFKKSLVSNTSDIFSKKGVSKKAKN